jgi:hypothetical protein
MAPCRDTVRAPPRGLQDLAEDLGQRHDYATDCSAEFHGRLFGSTRGVAAEAVDRPGGQPAVIVA